MDIENENLIAMKKNNRKIVQRAYQNSVINTNYKFPKTNITPEVYSQMSDSMSICSKVSEKYDLNQQNIRFNRFDDQSRKIAPFLSVLKLKEKKKDDSIYCERLMTLMSSRRQENGQKAVKRQFLSLTPNKKSQKMTQNFNNILRTSGINLSRRKQLNFSTQKSSNKNPQNCESSFIETMRKIAIRCLGNDHHQMRQNQQSEAIFYDKKFEFVKQTFIKKGKIIFSDKQTTDSTPLIGQKTISNNKNKHKCGMSIIKMQQNATVSPFLYN